ncbi:MAG: hypothetical protein ABSF23_00460 [Terracidiphilus sp.]|jgi:hypothetical protein
MGRQFRFYILPSDANALVERLRSQFEARVYADYSHAYELFEVDSPYPEYPARASRSRAGSNRYYLAPSFNTIARRYCPKPNWWVIDSDSEGIEFSGCEFDGSTLLIGRFWYQTDVVIKGLFISKSSEFLKWAEAVYRYTKKFLRYERAIDAYVGQDALSFREKGGRFASSIGPNGRINPA